MLLRDLRDPRTYTRIAYLLLALPLGIAEFVFLVTALSTGIGTAITLVGIPLLVLTMEAWRLMAKGERQLVARLLGPRIPEPYRPDRSEGIVERTLGRLADPATWKDLAFLLLQLPLGIVAFTLTAALVALPLWLLLAPAYYWAIPGDMGPPFFEIDTFAKAVAVVPLGAALAPLAATVVSALGRLYGDFAVLLLGRSDDPELTAQVDAQRDARARVIAAADAERRRIERDLHDGAQQRLVSLALQLGMARRRVDESDPEAGQLIATAHQEAEQALVDLRDLARGIHPAILTTRGLPAALDDLASRASLPVEVTEKPSERLSQPVEAAVYFVVSESLANVAKHAEADTAEVSVRVEGGEVIASVRDDGGGGASLDDGAGLQGLLDRVSALGGRLWVDSPPGAGTTVYARLPSRVAAAEDPLAHAPAHATAPAAIDSPELSHQRRRRFTVRAGTLGILAALLVVIWLATGAGYFWPVWPLLALAAVVAVDAVVSVARPRLPFGRRGLVVRSAVLGILGAFLIGVWAAADGGYFWPVWPLASLCAVIALDALVSAGGGRTTQG